MSESDSDSDSISQLIEESESSPESSKHSTMEDMSDSESHTEENNDADHDVDDQEDQTDEGKYSAPKFLREHVDKVVDEIRKIVAQNANCFLPSSVDWVWVLTKNLTVSTTGTMVT